MEKKHKSGNSGKLPANLAPRVGGAQGSASRLPIDFLLHSLAQDLQDRSIGVSLSVMGSNGTMGLRAITEKAGVCDEKAKIKGKQWE